VTARLLFGAAELLKLQVGDNHSLIMLNPQPTSSLAWLILCISWIDELKTFGTGEPFRQCFLFT
jgi:hypothetical protein